MHAVPARGVLACVVVLTTAASAARSEPGHGGRFRVAAGPSFVSGGATGWVVNGGGEVGGRIRLTLEAGYERYPRGSDSYLTNNLAGGPPTLRVEAAGSPSRITATAGLRVIVPAEAMESFFDFGIGGGVHRDPGRRLVDPSTGAVFSAARSEETSVVIADAGAGIRTRRAGGFDGLLELRIQALGASEGTGELSFRVCLGLVTP